MPKTVFYDFFTHFCRLFSDYRANGYGYGDMLNV